MNLNQFLIVSALGAGIAVSEPHGEPYTSVGALEGSGLLTGAQLRWEIHHPSTATDKVVVDGATGSLTTRVELRVRMHVVGVGTKTSPGPHRAVFWSSVGSVPQWVLAFDGTPRTLNAVESVVDQLVPAHTRIDLGGRGAKEGGEQWFAACGTTVASPGVLVLRNGDPVPGNVLADRESFLEAYLGDAPDGSGGKVVKIGPTNLLYLFELSDVSTGSYYFDQQDLAVLVTFECP